MCVLHSQRHLAPGSLIFSTCRLLHRPARCLDEAQGRVQACSLREGEGEGERGGEGRGEREGGRGRRRERRRVEGGGEEEERGEGEGERGGRGERRRRGREEEERGEGETGGGGRGERGERRRRRRGHQKRTHTNIYTVSQCSSMSHRVLCLHSASYEVCTFYM